MVLDIASGTGDIARGLAKQVKGKWKIIATDINDTMLFIGRDRAIDQSLLNQIKHILADAENLPFKDNCFDRITLAFGLRNMTHKEKALSALYRVLKPGGKCLILEFSHPTQAWVKKTYNAYSFHIIPALGEWIAKDRESYQYLVESIRMHPDQESLTKMMQDAGFEDVTYFNLAGGIVALHVGWKYQ